MTSDTLPVAGGPGSPPFTAREVHLLDGRHLLRALPRLDQGDLHEVRVEFARFVEARGRREPFATWQDAWNAFTGATPSRPGVVEYTPARCKACHGRGFDTRHVSRNLSRTGSPYVCGECRGSRRGTRERIVAIYVQPADDPSA